MTSRIPVLGIDFGTSNSKMAWYNPKTGQAEILLNSDGEQQTPSVVYFGSHETIVGKDALEKLEYFEEWERVIISIKREMVKAAPIALADRVVRATDVAAEILRKLKRDAEEGHFHEEIKYAVITYPAKFDSLEQDKIRDAALAAGFHEVELLKEPVAAAYTYAQMGQKVGRYVLVYDLGGGTFDLAVLAREDESFFPVLPAQGIKRCGGDDFDDAIYDYCDSIAQRDLKRPISLTNRRDLYFLFECRKRKHNLTTSERSIFSSLLQPDAVRFRHELDRATFERLIRSKVEETVQQTRAILDQARDEGYQVDTFVLIGGSSSVPLVESLLKQHLSLVPLKFDKRNVAVALGAAYLAHKKWNPEATPKPSLKPTPTPSPQPVRTPPVRTIPPKPPVPRQDVAAAEYFTLARTLSGHNGWIRSLTLNQNGQVLVSGSEDGTIKLWNPNTGQQLKTLTDHMGRREGQGVFSVAFSPDGVLFASGGADQKVRVWNSTGHLLRILSGHKGLFADVNAVAFGAGILASGSNDKTIKLWNPGSGLSLGSLVGHTDIILSLAFSPDGQILASGSADKTIRLWHPQSQRLLGTLIGHTDSVRSIAFSPDKPLLISGSSDQTITIWNPQTRQRMRTLTGHTAAVWSVSFGGRVGLSGSDSNIFVSGSLDESVKVWNIQTGELLATLPGHSPGTRAVVLGPVGASLVSGGDDKRIKIWRKN